MTYAVLALALTACTGGGDDGVPDPKVKIDGETVYADLPHDHVQGDVIYDQTPPAGGKHSPVWLRCGVYTEHVPEENAVHAMEHGAVWITYVPDLPADDVAKLKNLQALKPEYVIVSPFSGLPSKVVASTWAHQLRMDDVGDPRLSAFVKEYAGGGQGGELGADCANGATPEQIRSRGGGAS